MKSIYNWALEVIINKIIIILISLFGLIACTNLRAATVVYIVYKPSENMFHIVTEVDGAVVEELIVSSDDFEE